MDQPNPSENQDDFETLWRQYYERLVRYARTRLGTLPRRDADEEDVALSAMKSFYRGWSEGRFPQINDPDDLWKLLLTITARKANKRIRYQRAEKRGSGKVRGESVFGDSATGLDEVLAAGPSAEEAEQIVSQCEEMLELLPDESLARIAVLKLEGFTNEEIADQLQCALRTVERKLFRVRLSWNHLLEE